MDDVIGLTLALAREADAALELRRRFALHTAELRASAGRADRNQVVEAEDAVQADPQQALRFDVTGSATLTAAGATWNAGRFETVSLTDLRQRALSRQSPNRAVNVRFWVFDGISP